MKAIVYGRYGSPDVLELKDVPDPVVDDDEVLIRVRAASANPRDWHFLRGLPYVARLSSQVRQAKHRPLGSDVAGVVQTVGTNVTCFLPGDEVYSDAVWGGFAEYVSVPEQFVAFRPVNVTFEEAAAVPLAGVTALQGVRDQGGIERGQRVLIVGAGGGIGTLAVQLAKSFGAHVTGVCSATKVDMVDSLGADEVIDYTQRDFTTNGPSYDLIFQLAGTQSPSACRRALTRRGTLLLSSGQSNGRWVGPIGRILKAAVLSPLVSQRLVALVAKRSCKDLETLKQLIEAGSLKPVIDRTYPLSSAPDAIRYLESGHASGKVVITV